MDYYFDIRMVPDDDIPIYFIRNKVYTKFHKALCDLKATDIGISFPKYRVKLGEVIRIHASSDRLKELQMMNWLGGLSGYCDVSDILPVPKTVEGYRTVSRVQPTMTLAKLEKRVKYQKANGDLITKEEVESYKKQYKAKMFAQGLDNPYLELQSNSNGHKHRRFIQFGELLESCTEGEFDQFGLSKTASIPWF